MDKTNERKAAWAARRARELRAAADALPVVPGGDWRGVQQRAGMVRHYHREADRFDRIAERFRRAA